MKILKILGIAAGVHALALIVIFANPGCSSSKASATDPSPITSAPGSDTPSQAAAPAVVAPSSEGATIRYSPTRPGTTVASALASQPASDVTPATTYIVARGDSLSSIAKRNQLSKGDLAAANNLRSSSVLHVGQKLIIPSKATHAEPAVSAAAQESASSEPAAGKGSGDALKHVVKSGETLGAIARKYGVKQGDIAVANNITDPRKIQPGQELVIPTRSSTSSKQTKPAKTGAAAAPEPAAAPAAEQDLDAGLKPPSSTDVPVIKIEDPAAAQQPKSP